MIKQTKLKDRLVAGLTLGLLLLLAGPQVVPGDCPERAGSACAAGESEESAVKARLLADCKELVPGSKFRLGVELVMDPGWHTYYRESGDAGMPTKINWELPSGFKSAELLWEKPERLEDAGIVTYGYNRRTVIASSIDIPPDLKSGSTLKFKAQVKWLSCKDACVPGSANLELSLPVASTGTTAQPVNADSFKNVNFNGPASEIKSEGAGSESQKKKTRAMSF